MISNAYINTTHSNGGRAKIRNHGFGKTISPQLKYFQNETKAKHAFQVSLTENFVDRNCFEIYEPVIVPASTFLSQLV